MSVRRRPPTTPTWPVVGKPEGAASKSLRVDFKPNDFADMIETKTGRIAWSRATICDCVGFSGQTGQPDPTCTHCNKKGYRFFKPIGYVVDTTKLGKFDALQTKLIADSNAVVIRGLLVGLTKQPTIYEALGPWATGSAMITLRSENVAGYYDRITQLDDDAPFSEVLTVDDTDFMSTRYPCVQINVVLSGDTQFKPDVDYVTQDDGRVKWKSGKKPDVGTRVSINYQYRPVWTVMEWTNLIRSSLALQRIANPESPDGSHIKLPRRFLVRLEYLPMPPASP